MKTNYFGVSIWVKTQAGDVLLKVPQPERDMSRVLKALSEAIELTPTEARLIEVALRRHAATFGHGEDFEVATALAGRMSDHAEALNPAPRCKYCGHANRADEVACAYQGCGASDWRKVAEVVAS